MRAIHIVFASQLLLVGMSAHARGQDSSPSTNGTNLATEVQELREALSQTQEQLAAQAADSAQQASAQHYKQTENSPTGSFKFDNAILELGGFVDFENVFRTRHEADSRRD